jgi:hypothetical protein
VKKSLIGHFLLISILAYGCVFGFGQQIGLESFLINPLSSVGRIVPNSTEADLIRTYGAKNVKRVTIDVGEGETVQGSVLFPGTPDAVEIEWAKLYSQPVRISISSKGTKWRTREGITIGTSLDELEVINGGLFSLTGFGWDYEGRTVSWEKGKLPKQLYLDLKPIKAVPEKTFENVLGDRSFSSSFPGMIKLKLAVKKIFVRWE